MGNIVLVKLGGSLITDKARERTVRRADLLRLVAELAAALRGGRRTVLLGHGSGSFGHVAAARHRVQEGARGRGQLPGISRTQSEAAALHRIVIQALRDAGLNPFSIVPSSAIVTRQGRSGTVAVSVAAEPLLRALDAGLLPVTYGDVVMDRDQGVAICSTEVALVALARRLLRSGRRITRALWFGDTAGILDAQGRTIRRVRPGGGRALRELVGGAAATDVTGGMRHRLDAALTLARLGIPSLIASGREPGLVERALRGRAVAGTRVEPSSDEPEGRSRG